MKEIIPAERIQQAIYLIRGQKVLLSIDLAKLYDVEPRGLVQAVKRNIDRFPPDFMFQLSKQEFTNLKSQIVISSNNIFVIRFLVSLDYTISSYHTYIYINIIILHFITG